MALLPGVSRAEEATEPQPIGVEQRLGCSESRGQEKVAPETALTEQQARAREAAEPMPPGGAGMRVFLDPQTGRLVDRDQLPPEALSALEQAMLRRDTAGLIQRTLPGGAVVVDLQNRFHHFAVASIDRNGGVSSTRCVTSAEAARPRARTDGRHRAAHGD
jgi:hypothetical protein